MAGVQYGTPPSGKGRADSSGCVWVPAGELGTTGGYVATEKIVNGVKYELFLRACPATASGVWIPEVTPPTLGLSAENVITQRLAAPTLGSAPPVDKGIVKVGMWLWTDPAVYQPISITAWVPTTTGIAWATTTATPSRLLFQPGEPGATGMACQGPGQQWLPQYGDDMVSACMYTYQHSSQIAAGNAFAARLSIVWSINWRSNVARGGSLGTYSTSTDQPVVVNEIQAIVSN